MPIKSNGSKLRKIAGWTTLFITSTALHGAPVIPGVDRLTDNSDTLAGEILLGELACTQCHAAGDKTTTIWSKSAPNLSLVGARVTPQYLERFLKSTHSTKPGTTMPDIFHSSESNARDGAVDYLTHFLTSLGGPIAPSTSGGSQKMVDHGKKLFHTVGCVACHGPQEEEGSDDFKPLGNLAEKTTVDALTEFLLDPHQARPSGRMPSLWLSRDDARAISVYLLRKQLENEQSKDAPPANQPGLYVDYYEIDGINKLPDFSQHTPITKSKTDSITLDLGFKTRKNNYALRFHGQIIIEETNQYRFGTRSDDGSQIRINGELVVDNDGTHGPRPRAGDIKLEAGTHDFELTFFNAGAGDELQVFWRKGVHEEGSRRGYGGDSFERLYALWRPPDGATQFSRVHR